MRHEACDEAGTKVFQRSFKCNVRIPSRTLGVVRGHLSALSKAQTTLADDSGGRRVYQQGVCVTNARGGGTYEKELAELLSVKPTALATVVLPAYTDVISTSEVDSPYVFAI